MADLSPEAKLIEQTASQDLSAGSLDFTTTFDYDFRLVSVLLHLSGLVNNQELVVEVDALGGANYDTVIGRRTLRNNEDVQFAPAAEGQVFKKGNEIRVTLENNGSPSITAYLTVIGEMN
ncbi:MAG: hypothetical protein DRH08_10585 [Deltaproteobacteria bacterium]|nr:MAG: hypothetical protein DRH08_10585 [Deltaproteobacteria bacterium]